MCVKIHPLFGSVISSCLYFSSSLEKVPGNTGTYPSAGKWIQRKEVSYHSDTMLKIRSFCCTHGTGKLYQIIIYTIDQKRPGRLIRVLSLLFLETVAKPRRPFLGPNSPSWKRCNGPTLHSFAIPKQVSAVWVWSQTDSAPLDHFWAFFALFSFFSPVQFHTLNNSNRLQFVAMKADMLHL